MVLGYADAAKWVYEQALTPLGWGHDGLIALTEVRHVHALAMGKVWEVAPQPEASLQESPGNFRTHEIHEFAGGMKPPSHPLNHSKLTALVNEINEVGRRIDAGTLASENVPEKLEWMHRGFEQIPRLSMATDGRGDWS